MSKENLAKNTLFFTTALAIQKLLSFVYFIFIARAISVEDMGKFSFALGFSALFGMFLDFGMSQVLTRESARNKDESQKYLSNVLGLKLSGALFVYLLIVLMVNIMGYPEITRNMVYVTGFIMIIDSLTVSFYSVLRGMQNLIFESLGVIINQVIVLIIGLLVIKLDLGLVVLITVYLIGSLFNLIYSSSFLSFKYKVFPRPQITKKVVISIIKISLPFAIAALFIRVYSYIDIILLSKLANDEAVGIYSVAYKAAFALQFIATAFSAAIYPAFCKYFVSSKEMLAKTFEKSIYYLILIAMPLSVGVITIADKIVGPLFGYEYNLSILPLQILMLAMVPVFITFAIGAILNAANKQTQNTIILGIITLVNIVSNLILIPLFGYIGPAISVLISFVVFFIIGMPIVGRIVEYDKKHLFVSFLKILFSCLVMGLVVLYLKNYMHFIIVIPISIVIYFTLLFVVRGFSKRDILQLKNLLLKREAKIYDINSNTNI